MSFNLVSISPIEIVGLLAGLFLTLSIFSYVFGDNFLFRLAIHIFIGVAAGYLGVLIIYNVIWPKVILPVLELPETGGAALISLIPLLLSLLLVSKLIPRIRGFGTPVMAYLVGIGAAVAIGGAMVGTLLPQASAAVNQFNFPPVNNISGSRWFILVESILILVGTLSTLIYFHFGASIDEQGNSRRAFWIESIAKFGKIFIVITFGAIFANILMASLAALTERVNFFFSLLSS